MDSAAIRDSAKWRLSSWFHNVFCHHDDILKYPGIWYNGQHNGEYQTCMVVGWGLDKALGFYRLRAAEVLLFSKKVCASVLKKVSKYDFTCNLYVQFIVDIDFNYRIRKELVA